MQITTKNNREYLIYEVINWPNEKVDKTVDKIKKDSSSNSLELLDANAKNDDFSLQASHTPEWRCFPENTVSADTYLWNYPLPYKLRYFPLAPQSQHDPAHRLGLLVLVHPGGLMCRHVFILLTPRKCPLCEYECLFVNRLWRYHSTAHRDLSRENFEGIWIGHALHNMQKGVQLLDFPKAVRRTFFVKLPHLR